MKIYYKQFITTITIIIYTNMVLAEDLRRDVPKQKIEACFDLWNDTLINDFDGWIKFNENKSIDLINNQDILDPLFGIEL